MTEIEAKFIIRRREQIDEALRVLSDMGYAIARRGVSTHLDRYFDTLDWSILAAGWACRLRHREDRDTLTLKSLAGAAGDGNVFVRAEINQEMKPGNVQPRFDFPAGAVREKLRNIVDGAHAIELFRVECRRTIYKLDKAGPQPVEIEMDLDESRIDAEKRSEKATGIVTFTELEIELKSGSAADVESAARLLRDEAGLTPAQFSKFERGLQAAGVEPESILEETQAGALDEDDPVLRLLFQYLGEQVKIILRQHPRALEGIDPEGVHQLRVASRRLRAVLKAFAGIIGSEFVSRFNEELRWLARNLGRARDADVTGQGISGSDGLTAEHYRQFVEEETISAYEHLVEILQSERCAALVNELTRFVTAGPGPELQDRIGDLSIRDCAQQFIHVALVKLLAHGDRIGPDSPAKHLHKLRIESKRFRYLLDFFSTVQGDKWQHTTEAVKQLQDVLGEHQDAITAQAQLADYAESLRLDENARDKLLATGRLMQKEDERIAASRERFAATWSDFKALVD